MKKLMLLAAVAVFGLSNVSAQDSDNGGSALSEGSFVIEANTGSWTTGMTGFSLASSDGETQWSIGAEAGYFVMDNLAIKAGLGYQDYGGDFSSFAYKIGAKYYIVGQFPVGIDYTGVSYKDADENPSYVGIQGGYAWFITPKVSIEPTLRYNITLDEMKANSAFQALIGFAIHL